MPFHSQGGGGGGGVGGFIRDNAGTIIGGAAGGLGAAFSGPETSTTTFDEQSQRYIDLQRQFGTAAANAITGFNPETGQFGEPSIGPITEQFDMSSIERFLNPFLDEQRGLINEDFDISRARDIRGARQDATLAGTGRGSRGAVLEGLAGEGSDRNRARALNDISLRGFGEAGRLAIGAQPFRNLFAREPLDRLQAGQNFLTGGFGEAGQIVTGDKPNIASGIIAGATAGSSFDQRGPGVPAAPGTIPPVGPPPAPGFPPIGRGPSPLAPPPHPGRPVDPITGIPLSFNF